ncbi:MAG: alpha/beta fold hydrolase [Anaerolineae bacterium]|nr:alpha/beta fold hydrolase [Anaerolineae bacterium]
MAALAAGATFLTFVAPVVGEVIATLPPPFPKEPVTPLTAAGLAYEEVAFATTDGLTLRGWFVPAGQLDGPAIVYAPATSHDQRSGLSLLPAFHEAGYHVLLFSYRGHGQSDGLTGRFTYGEAESRDVDAAVQFLRQGKGVGRIALVGHSVGAVSAILSAARNPQVGAVVAVAPFTCVSEVWQTSRPKLVPRFILDWTLWIAEKTRGFDRDQVCPLDVVQDIAPRPLLIIHGTADRRITVEQVRRLLGAAGRPKSLWLVKGASHSGVRSPALDVLAPEVVTFLQAAWQRPREPVTGLAWEPVAQISMQ